jgi:hypothetical protein
MKGLIEELLKDFILVCIHTKDDQLKADAAQKLTNEVTNVKNKTYIKT